MRQYDVYKMNCAACSSRVEKAVSALEGVEKCSVNLLTNSMSVEGNATDEEIINAVIAAGSVVIRDVPADTLVAGNPARVIRKITAEDRNKYPWAEQDKK